MEIFNALKRSWNNSIHQIASGENFYNNFRKFQQEYKKNL